MSSCALFDPRNDAAYWWPLLSEIATKNYIPVPETIMISTDINLIETIEGPWPAGWKEFLRDIRKAAQAVGTPCFLRTGQTSGKHNWSQTCFIDSLAVFPAHIRAIVEFSEMIGIIGLPTKTWLVRKLIETESAFRIPAYCHMPINKERRYFVSKGQVIAHRPYWPPDVVERDDPDMAAVTQRGLPEDWRELLAHISEEGEDEICVLSHFSRVISARFDGAWSIDFLQGVDGAWYCIDMALAAASWGCPEQLKGKIMSEETTSLLIELSEYDKGLCFRLTAIELSRFTNYGFGTFLENVKPEEVEISADALAKLLEQPERSGLQGLEFWADNRLAWGSSALVFLVPVEMTNVPEKAKIWIRKFRVVESEGGE